MTPSEITTLLSALAAVLTALAAVIRAWRGERR